MTTAKAAKSAGPTSHISLEEAMAAFQAELPRVGKDNTAQVRSDKGSYQYRYADLSEITPAVLPLLAKHGLSWTTRPTIVHIGDVERFVLCYQLAHTCGDTINGQYPLPNPNSSPQVLGSAITYARRYCLCAVTGVAPGDDDDDAAAAQERVTAAQERRQERAKPVRPAPEQLCTPATTLPAQAADAARRLLHQTVVQNGWSPDKVRALFARVHDGTDLLAGTAKDVEAFRKGLFARPDHELRDDPELPLETAEKAE